jgi:DNA polymerase elongation subunit (family B)
MDSRAPQRASVASALEFQCVSWYHEDVSEDVDDPLHLVVKAFGVDGAGRSVALTILGFRPYFYVEATPAAAHLWSVATKSGGDLRVTSVRLRDFWGFQADDTKAFLRVDCRSVRKFKATVYEAKSHGLNLFESNIDPVLRFCHVRRLRPCGWVRCAAGEWVVNKPVLPSKCTIDATCQWDAVEPVLDREDLAPMRVMSFDIECTSSHGDFPVAVKSYKKLAVELYAGYHDEQRACKHDAHWLRRCLEAAFGLDDMPGISRVHLLRAHDDARVRELIGRHQEDICGVLKQQKRVFLDMKPRADKDRSPTWNVLKGRAAVKVVPHQQGSARRPKDQVLDDLDALLCHALPKNIEGDKIIQIGSTFHHYGQQETCYRHVATLGGCEPIEGADVHACASEAELLLTWARLVDATDPDILTGYNILGFDFAYVRERAEEVGVDAAFEALLGRIRNKRAAFKVSTLSSSALGDNILKYYDVTGRCIIDLMKVVQRDHRLDSYKLDHVAETFLGERKHDIGPGDIFRLQRGSDADRCTVAKYCLQDCALVNRLLIRLETVANNAGMANVCLVPLAYIFLRGQGVKVFSLVAKQCADDGYVVPTRAMGQDAAEDEGYEGAIVLEPQTGMYFDDVVAVMDYNSLYPSSIISENLSHDTIVLDAKYDNLPGVEYNEVTYDVHNEAKQVIGQQRCRFVVNRQGVIPRILQKLLKARKETRKRIHLKRAACADGEERCGYLGEDGVLTTPDGARHAAAADARDHYDSFQKAVLEGLQNAYKVTANSIYGQMGARTSPVYLKDIAACTTAVGRSMIVKAKAFMEAHYGARVIYGDTDSLFVIFPPGPGEARVTGEAALRRAMRLSDEATAAFNPTLKAPQNLEAEKCFYPFVLLSKKRYIGMMYPQGSVQGKRKEMGVALKRRDNAPIVKHVLGGIVDIILKERDLARSVRFLHDCLDRLIRDEVALEDLVITKSLRATYADPTRIAHKVLAERMGERDPGSKPQANDRIKYVYIESQGRLQGERIETPEYVREHRLRVDYRHYITNQIMNPVVQLYAIVLEQLPGYKRKPVQMTLNGGVASVGEKKDRENREKEVEQLLFVPALRKLDGSRPSKALVRKDKNQHLITRFCNAP